ncbi:MAG TPA: hypothetical protein VE990_09050 [Acidimicrobiales bacterium]|nr:hypothetical protein [Acidimicrobiales bacterium]
MTGAAGVTSGGPAGPGRAVELARQRDELRALAGALASCPPVVHERTASEMRERLALTAALRRSFVGHETVKLLRVWPVLRRHDPGAVPLIAESVQLKKRAEELMVKLGWAGERDESINDDTAALLGLVEEVLRIEEGLVAQLEVLVPADELARLQRRLHRGLRWSPTRAHPELPSGFRSARLLAPLVGVVDRLRDLCAPRVAPT